MPADGPPAWTSGTLFPQSSRKTARAINAATNNRPLVVLANLSGFDGSPESMRMRQLEYGAEIGGTPAAATVFGRDVKLRTEADPRVKAARKAVAAASGAEAARLRGALAQVTEQVRSEKLGEVAAEFDGIHDIERARRVGSVDRIIKAAEIRPYIVRRRARARDGAHDRLSAPAGAARPGERAVLAAAQVARECGWGLVPGRIAGRATAGAGWQLDPNAWWPHGGG